MQTLTPEWPRPARVRAAFTLRGGGHSTGRYASLNLGTHVGDSPAAVAQNRAALQAALALPGEPQWLQQQHGPSLIDLDLDGARVGDAALTRTPGRVCAVLVADCLPVLLATRRGDAVGIAHAGWRGLAAGVLEAAVAGFGGEPLLAWLGPAISAAHFEVGEEVRSACIADDAGAAEAFIANARGRWQCDLYALARRRLARAGVESVSGAPCCTYADAARFFSYRRDGVTGRMAALIWLH